MFKAWPLAKSAGVTSSSVLKCPNYNYGDFQCNAAMSLCKALKVGKNVKTNVGAAVLPTTMLVVSRRRDSQRAIRYCTAIHVAPCMVKSILKGVLTTSLHLLLQHGKNVAGRQKHGCSRCACQVPNFGRRQHKLYRCVGNLGGGDGWLWLWWCWCWCYVGCP